MRDFLLVALTFIIAVTAASATAWPLYSWLSLEQWVEFGKFTKWLAILLVAAATVGVLRLRGRLHWPMVGFDAPRKPWPLLLATGFVAGFLMLGSLGAALYLLGIRVPDTDKTLLESLAKLVLGVLPAALAVSLIEETYFRGVQFTALARRQRVAAVILPAVFYMAVHFLNPQDDVAGHDPDWFYGITLLFEAPVAICRETDCAGAGATLFLAGVLLALVRLRGGHLLTCIGIHAGWIAGIKLTRNLTNFDHHADLAFLAGGGDRFTGILAAAWLAVPCAWLIKRLVKNA